MFSLKGKLRPNLATQRARTIVESLTTKKLTAFFEEKKNGTIGEVIIGKAKGAAKVREAAKESKKNSLVPKTLLKTLTSLANLLPQLHETESSANFLSLRVILRAEVQNKEEIDAFRTILPLRGKPLNAEKKRIDQVLANEGNQDNHISARHRHW